MDNFTTIDQGQIRAYLLGNLPESDVERFDELSVTDPETADLINSVERDLIDEYAAGSLSTAELANFEKKYLASPAYRERIAFARRLPDLAPPTTAASSAVTETERASFWDIFRPRALQIGFAALLLGLISVAGWLVLRPAGDNFVATGGPEPLNTTSTVGPSVTPSAAGDLSTLPERASNDLPEVQERTDGRPPVTPTPAPAPPRATVATLVFAPAIRGAGVKVLKLPATVTDVELRVGMETPPDAAARVKVTSAATQRVVWSGAAGRRSKGYVARIPANLLKPGTYSMTVESGRETVVEHFFEVVR